MPNPQSLRRVVGSILWHGTAIAVSGLFTLPLYWMVAASLRKAGLPPPRTIEWLPNPLAFSNYERVFDLLPFATYTLNSLLVTSLGVILTLITASWAGFAVAQLPERARRLFTIFSLLLLVVPLTSLWLPRLVLYRALDLIDNYGALVAPALMGTSPLFVLLFYWAARRIPSELIEAARLEGAGALTIWWRVLLPLARPTVLAVGALTFITYWGDFISPLLYLKSQALYTLPVGVQHLFQMDKTNWPLMLAGAVVMTLPPVVLFLLAQRFLLRDKVLEELYER
jgi:multiple sugar transport system permease protein